MNKEILSKIEIRIMFGGNGVYTSEHHSWQTDYEQAEDIVAELCSRGYHAYICHSEGEEEIN